MHGTRRSELGERVARLGETLAPRAPAYPTAQRQALREAKAAVDAAKTRLGEVARRVGSVAGYAERGKALPKELVEARRTLEDAERDAVKLRDAFAKAKQEREAKFLAAASAQIGEAAPTLVELIRLMNAGFSPLVDLAQFGMMHNLPMPRALGMAMELGEALRRCTAIVNAMAPAMGDDESAVR